MSIKVSIKATTPSLQRALKEIKMYDGKSRLRIEAALRNATIRVKRGALARVPVDTGLLKSSIKHTFSVRTMVGTVKAEKPHAHLIEYGVKANVFKPKKKKALKLGTGQYASFYKKIKMPARKPRPFMRPAFDAVAPTLEAEIAKELRKK